MPAGDFNLDSARSKAFEALGCLGFSPPGPGIDHVLVRGAETSMLASWASERRRRQGVLLSDHAPVELTILRATQPADVPAGALGMRDRVELTRYAIRRGLVEP